MTDMPTTTRRRLLALASTATLTGLAGCIFPSAGHFTCETGCEYIDEYNVDRNSPIGGSAQTVSISFTSPFTGRLVIERRDGNTLKETRERDLTDRHTANQTFTGDYGDDFHIHLHPDETEEDDETTDSLTDHSLHRVPPLHSNY